MAARPRAYRKAAIPGRTYRPPTRHRRSSPPRSASGWPTCFPEQAVHSRGFDVLSDAAAGFVVADMGQEIDIATQPGESDGDVERASTDMLGSVAPVLDDVDQRFTDHQPAGHGLTPSVTAQQCLQGCPRPAGMQRIQRPAIGLDEAGCPCQIPEQRGVFDEGGRILPLRPRDGHQRIRQVVDDLDRFATLVDRLGVAGPACDRRRRQPDGSSGAQVVADHRKQPFRDAVRRVGAQPRHGVPHSRVGEALDEPAGVVTQIDAGDRPQRRHRFGIEIGQQEFGQQRVARRVVHHAIPA